MAYHAYGSEANLIGTGSGKETNLIGTGIGTTNIFIETGIGKTQTHQPYFQNALRPFSR